MKGKKNMTNKQLGVVIKLAQEVVKTHTKKEAIKLFDEIQEELGIKKETAPSGSSKAVGAD